MASHVAESVGSTVVAARRTFVASWRATALANRRDKNQTVMVAGRTVRRMMRYVSWRAAAVAESAISSRGMDDCAGMYVARNTAGTHSATVSTLGGMTVALKYPTGDMVVQLPTELSGQQKAHGILRVPELDANWTACTAEVPDEECCYLD